MKKKILPTLFTFYYHLLNSQIVPSLCFTSFLFGDSLVDTGNNNYLFTLSKADSPPYGIDFAPSGGHPTGRFTNGHTIGDLIGEALGAKSFPPPYLSPNAAAYAFDVGVNYASGGSGILNGTGTLFIERLPLSEQISNFEMTRNYMVSSAGENRTKDVLKNTVFSITIGSNDVINYFQQPFAFLNGNVSMATFQDFMVSNLTEQLKRLHGLGARKIVVVGIGPLGCIPFIRAISLVPSRECAATVNAFVSSYNQRLKVEINQLNVDAGADAIFVYVNSYDIFLEIIDNYGDYGFGNNDGPCCGGYVPPFFCYDGNGNNATAAACPNRSAYVFWDAYHPTDAANRIVADRLLDGDENDCSPVNIRQLYYHEFT
ncbi:GDSL esterase/lipase At5g41890 [Andrographis paniculata]|uniref:GDSL esterase/lipase At5g41890 n=1 Tax=Andrographis paniculata TaxID=175694 RepID=UPI0021E95272|nr:GDSL esterase/lipase At5g41890 [Andrographis paniculata]